MKLKIYLGVSLDNGKTQFSLVRHLALDEPHLSVSGDEFQGSELVLGQLFERIKNRKPPSMVLILEEKTTNPLHIVTLYDAQAANTKFGVVGVGAGEWFDHKLPNKLANLVDPHLRIDAMLRLWNASVTIKPLRTVTGITNHFVKFQGDKVQEEEVQY